MPDMTTILRSTSLCVPSSYRGVLLLSDPDHGPGLGRQDGGQVPSVLHLKPQAVRMAAVLPMEVTLRRCLLLFVIISSLEQPSGIDRLRWGNPASGRFDNVGNVVF